MDKRETQLELPFETGILPVEQIQNPPSQIIALEAVRLRRHAERVLRELVDEGFAVRA